MECCVCYDKVLNKSLCVCKAVFCKDCILSEEWRKPLCLACNTELPKIDLIIWIGRACWKNYFSQYFTDQLINHEKKLLPVAQTYIDWLKYQDEKKRYRRWGSQAIKRGFVPHPELELDLDTFIESTESSIELHVASSKMYNCAKKDCNGMVIFSKCSVCYTNFCSKCEEAIESIEDKSHKCNKDMLATIENIRQNTKPCPSCKTPIEKSYGCDHMRCTYCSTYFNWNTGAISGTKNSNPIRDNELLKSSIIPGEMPILKEEDMRTDLKYCLYTKDPVIINTFIEVKFDLNKHIKKTTVQRLELRIKFLKGTLTEAKWAQELLNIHEEVDYCTLMNKSLSDHIQTLNKLRDNDTSASSWLSAVHTTNRLLSLYATIFARKPTELKVSLNTDPPII